MSAPALGDTFERSPSRPVVPPVFRDRPGDLGLPDAIAKTLAIRGRAAKGERISKNDLNGFTRTLGGNRAKLLIDRQYFEEGLAPAIDAAEHSIHMSAFMFDDSVIGTDLADRLIHKKMSNPNIRIRLLVDGKDFIFSRFNGHGANVRRLREAGIDVMVYPTLLLRSVEHRKLAIIDGKKALLSGTNCSTEYYASPRYTALYEEALEKGGEAVERFLAEKHGDAYRDYWARVKADPSTLEREPYPPTEHVERHMIEPWAHDYGVELEGPAVAHLQASFVQSWIQRGGEFEPNLDETQIVERYFSPAEAPGVGQGEGLARVTHGIPFGPSEVRAAMLDYVASAQKTLDLEVAYLYVRDFRDALVEAARRGVKIRLITNGKEGTDIVSTWYGFRKMCGPLLAEPNIEIYETKTFTHLKLMVADERLVLAATGNPERISWERTFDEIVAIDSPELATAVRERVMDRDVLPDRSTRVDPKDYARRGVKQRFLEWLWTLLSTLMLPVADHSGERPALEGPKEEGAR